MDKNTENYKFMLFYKNPLSSFISALQWGMMGGWGWIGWGEGKRNGLQLFLQHDVLQSYPPVDIIM